MQINLYSIDAISEKVVLHGPDDFGIIEIELSDGTKIHIMEETGDFELGPCLSINMPDDRMMIQPRAANAAYITQVVRKRPRKKKK